jgi:phosphoribosyl-AMP cyclohydrolase
MEAGSNELLMLAHMNAEALALTLETGFAHYWSRSRGKIWKKGESSGELQRVVELRVDCDQDAIVLLVEQTGRGAACHTGRKSCFYRRVVTKDGTATLEDTGLPKLFDPKDVY